MNSDNISEVIVNILKLSNSVLDSVVPKDAKTHFRSACKEVLLGMIVVLDSYDEKHKSPTCEDAHVRNQRSHTINISD